MIIAISGYARAGKDTIADILTEDAGFERIAFADKLRECLYALNPIISADSLCGGEVEFVYLQDMVNHYGWDGIKKSLYAEEARRLLQRFGTEVGREILGNNIWVDATFITLDVTKNYVVTDCRFRNEAEATTRKGGQVWRVNRPGVGPINDHISEIGLDHWPFDKIINNHSSIEDLREKVLSHVEISS